MNQRKQKEVTRRSKLLAKQTIRFSEVEGEAKTSLSSLKISRKEVSSGRLYY